MTAKSINDWIKINPFELSQKLIGFIREVTQFDENIFIEGSIKITPTSLDCERLSCFTSRFDSKDDRVIQLLNDLDTNQSIKTSYNLMSPREVQSLGFGVGFSSESLLSP